MELIPTPQSRPPKLLNLPEAWAPSQPHPPRQPVGGQGTRRPRRILQGLGFRSPAADASECLRPQHASAGRVRTLFAFPPLRLWRTHKVPCRSKTPTRRKACRSDLRLGCTEPATGRGGRRRGMATSSNKVSGLEKGLRFSGYVRHSPEAHYDGD